MLIYYKENCTTDMTLLKVRDCFPYFIKCSKYIFFSHWFYSPLGPWPLIFSFMIILQTVGLLGPVISSSQGLST
jgi:hypothetical protein